MRADSTYIHYFSHITIHYSSSIFVNFFIFFIFVIEIWVFGFWQEGRIDEDGKLQCSYHGWSFDGCGSCVKIPQASSEGPEARAIGSPKACATRFPTLVSQGLLFVWPDENGWEKAKASKPPM